MTQERGAGTERARRNIKRVLEEHELKPTTRQARLEEEAYS